MRHDLKTWPEFFDAIRRGDKTFEVRMADRDFNRNDQLLLQEYDQPTKTFTGNTLTCLVTYVMRGGEFGVLEGYVVMGIRVMGSREAQPPPDEQERGENIKPSGDQSAAAGGEQRGWVNEH